MNNRRHNLKPYTGEVDSRLLMWCEKFGFDTNELREDEAGVLYVIEDVDPGFYHPDQRYQMTTRLRIVDLDEVSE